jgi:hypothetical protein
MTAMLCVENILADAKLYDLWQSTLSITNKATKFPTTKMDRRYALFQLESTANPS